MCTVTFIARQRGYALGMNRDEKLTRPPGHPPERRDLGGHAVLCPFETGGGTWIAVNDRGATFALINWYSVKAAVSGRTVSRGEVINAVSGNHLPGNLESILLGLPLSQINPFRLIAVFPEPGLVTEWRWNLCRLLRLDHSWKTRQWISSGFDEPTAEHARGKTFERVLRQRSAGSLDWLRRLHRSHSPHVGPFSTCMHRHDAASVSYTEVAVSSVRVEMRYHPEAPCHNLTPVLSQLKLRLPLNSGAAIPLPTP